MESSQSSSRLRQISALPLILAGKGSSGGGTGILPAELTLPAFAGAFFAAQANFGSRLHSWGTKAAVVAAQARYQPNRPTGVRRHHFRGSGRLRLSPSFLGDKGSSCGGTGTLPAEQRYRESADIFLRGSGRLRLSPSFLGDKASSCGGTGILPGERTLPGSAGNFISGLATEAGKRAA